MRAVITLLARPQVTKNKRERTKICPKFDTECEFCTFRSLTFVFGDQRANNYARTWIFPLETASKGPSTLQLTHNALLAVALWVSLMRQADVLAVTGKSFMVKKNKKK